MSEIEKCPKCGGTSGFGYTRIDKYFVIEEWGNRNSEAEFVKTIRETGPAICQNCGAKFSLKRMQATP